MTHVIEPNATGIDVGSTEMFVAVPVDRDPQPIRRFTIFTNDLVALADWLKQCGITRPWRIPNDVEIQGF